MILHYLLDTLTALLRDNSNRYEASHVLNVYSTVVPNITLIDHIVINGHAITNNIITKITNDNARAQADEFFLKLSLCLVTYFDIRLCICYMITQKHSRSTIIFKHDYFGSNVVIVLLTDERLKFLCEFWLYRQALKDYYKN